MVSMIRGGNEVMLCLLTSQGVPRGPSDLTMMYLVTSITVADNTSIEPVSETNTQLACKG